MYKIKKIKILSLAYTVAAIHLVFGILQALLLFVAKQFPQLTFLQSPELASLTLQQILLYSVVAYTVGGFLFGLVIGLAYNYVVKWTGGVSIQLEKHSK